MRLLVRFQPATNNNTLEKRSLDGLAQKQDRAFDSDDGAAKVSTRLRNYVTNTLLRNNVLNA